MSISAPAKLNLTLRVLGRRDDGFHELETLMVPLPGLADAIHFEPADSFRLEVEGADVGATEDNLVTRAVRLFAEQTGATCNYRILLQKRIPAGAGLGGGSSDAAAVLKELNELEGSGLSAAELEELGGQLGSDVPFFLRGCPCWCRGRGEILESTSVAPQEVLLLKPAFGVSTPDAYRHWSDAKPLPGVPYEPQEIAGVSLVNDLERPVYEKFLFLAEVKVWLLGQAEVKGALMSGSGATVFALLGEPGSGSVVAERAREELDPKLWWWTGRSGGA